MAGDDAEVLRFRGRHWAEAFDGMAWDDEPLGGPVGGGLGQLTEVVIIGDQVVDVVRRPVSGSGYECAALELRDRGLLAGVAPPPPPPAPVPSPHEQQLAWLTRIVGGEQALATLDAEPLGLDELLLDHVPTWLRGRVADIDRRLADWAPPLLGTEGRAAARRLLLRAVATEPGLVTRSDRDDLAAGAVIWAVAKGNDLLGPGRSVRPSVIQDVCGLRSTPSTRGEAFAHAVGGGSTRYGRPAWMYDARPAVIPLGGPDLLLSGFRRQLAALRDICLALRGHTPDDGRA